MMNPKTLYFFLICILVCNNSKAQDTVFINVNQPEWFDSSSYNYIKEKLEVKGLPMTYSPVLKISDSFPIRYGQVYLTAIADSTRIYREFSISDYQLHGKYVTHHVQSVSLGLAPEKEIKYYNTGQNYRQELYNAFGALKDGENFIGVKHRDVPDLVIKYPDSVSVLRLGTRTDRSYSYFKFEAEDYDTIINQLPAYKNVRVLELFRNKSRYCLIDSIQMDQIVKGLPGFSKIESLEINFSDLEEIPEQVFALKTLKSLKVRRLTNPRISSKIGTLSNLVDLTLAGPQIILPEELRYLNKLQKLEINSIQKTLALSKDSKALAPNIEYLYIHIGYRETATVYGLHHYTKIKQLVVNKGSIGNDISSLKELRSLSINDRNTKRLPKGILSLNKLETLVLMGMSASEIDPALFRLPNLKSVYLDSYKNDQREIEKLRKKYPSIIFGRG